MRLLTRPLVIAPLISSVSGTVRTTLLGEQLSIFPASLFWSIIRVHLEIDAVATVSVVIVVVLATPL